MKEVIDEQGRPTIRFPTVHRGDWFEQALAHAPERLEATAAGATVELLVWGKAGDPGILLAHGFAANAQWWSFIAPYLAEGRRVAALSFTGMGGSGRRSAYSIDLQAEELLGAARAAGLFEASTPPVIVAHSFGSFAAIIAAAIPGRWGGLVLIDPMLDDEHYMSRAGTRTRTGLARRSPSREALRERFRLMPPQECRDPAILAHITEAAIAGPAEHGSPDWGWSMDPQLTVVFNGGVEPILRSLVCPTAVLCGEASALMTPRVRRIISESLPSGATMVTIPDAAHHIMLDQPLALVAALRVLLTVWRAAADQRTPPPAITLNNGAVAR